MFKTITSCRICGESKLDTVMNLGNQVLTGVFPKKINQILPSGPVELVRCASSDGCGLVQLRQSYDVGEMYGSNYGYRSSLNASMVDHLSNKIDRIMKLGILKNGDNVLDIGSNDGTSLKCYPLKRFRAFGIDPTGTKFREYYPKDITLISDFFSSLTIRKNLGDIKFKVVTSFSMFYDLENPIEFSRDVSEILDDDGVWVIEQSYLPSMLKNNSFDTICHEHLEFYALKQIDWIMKRSGLKIIDVEFNDINGGSFSVTIAKQDSGIQPKFKELQAILDHEQSLRLEEPEIYESFKKRVETSRKETMDFLDNSRISKKKVYGLGASTKGNVLLQSYGINNSHIKAIGDVNPDKFGAYTPGSSIPIMSENDVLSANPDYLLVLPWHFRPFFEKLPSLKGRKIVFPLPTFEIVQL